MGKPRRGGRQVVTIPKPAEDRAVFCRRTRGMTPVEEHLRCPYCFGRVADVGGDAYNSFCDYDPAADPIHFGFPETHGRAVRG